MVLSATKLFIVSVKICTSIMVKVTFQIKSNKVKKSCTSWPGEFFFVMWVIGNEQFFKVGHIQVMGWQ